MSPEFIEKLKELAASDAWDKFDDESLKRATAGHLDEAFYVGHRDGQIELARDILSEINIDWFDAE